jgi:CheY-like chemotaxis protein
MQRPGMDGMQLARTVKADPVISSTHLIMLTSLGWRGDAREAREAGISAYLTKPVRQSRLFDAIATVMGTPEDATPEEAQPATPHSGRKEIAPSGARILIAEDNADNQKVAVRMLERLGYRADVAADGLEAVEALARIPYHAILMDVQMPEMDGYAATAEIRRREEGTERRTPIIAMTANALFEPVVLVVLLVLVLDTAPGNPVCPALLPVLLLGGVVRRPIDRRACHTA